MGGTGLKSHFGTIPTHLLSDKQLQEREEKKLDKHGDKFEIEGYVLTRKMKLYAEERIFGGVHRTMREWAEYCGVKENDIRRWNKMAGVQRYLEELRDFRMAHMNEAINSSLSSTVNTMIGELNKLVQLETKIVIGSGKRQRTMESASLVEQKREAIIGALKLLKEKGDGDFVLNINNSVSNKQNNITANIDSIPSEQDVDMEIDDLNSIEGMTDNGTRR